MITLLLASTLSVSSGAHEVEPASCRPELTLTVLDHYDPARLGLTETARLHTVRHLYEGAFDLDGRDGPPAFAVAREHVLAWMAATKAAGPEHRARIVDELGSASRAFTAVAIDPRKMRLLVAEPARPPGRRALAVLVEFPDRRRRDLMWRTELVIEERNADAHVVASVLTWRPSGRYPLEDSPAAPRVLRDLLDDRRLVARSGAVPLSARPVTVAGADLPAFLRTVQDPDRALPLVFVSRDADGDARVNLNRLAERLRGFAVVMVESDEAFSPVTRVLKDVSSRLFVDGGDIRVIGRQGRDLGDLKMRAHETEELFRARVIAYVTELGRRRTSVDRRAFVRSVFDLIP